MKNPGRMDYVTRQLVATLFSLSMVILFAGAAQAAINCTQCHGVASTSALPKDTLVASASYRNLTTGAIKGNHETHSGAVTTGAPCARCHGAAAASYTSNHAILKHYSIQISASMNYSKGTAFPQSSNPTLGTCSTVNCHFQTITPNWGQVLPWSSGKIANDNNPNCNTCHATTALSTGAHAKHITASGGTQAACNQCHPDYNNAANTLAFKHATSNTGSIKISFALAPNGTGSIADPIRTGSTFLPSAATNSTATCSATYCHGSGASPAWTGGTTTCASCHSANSTLPGAHQAHVQTTPLATSYTNMSGNVSSATLYRFSCAACHSNTAGAVHVNGPSLGGGANGPAEVFYGFTSVSRKATAYNYGSLAGTDPTAGMNYTAGGSGTCSTTYCHSDGNGGIGDKTTFTWAAPSSTNRLRCNGCHGVQDWKLAGAQSAQNYSSIRTQAHARHVRGDINTELNVGNGIDCYRCHGATVSAAMNSYSTVGANVLNKKRHVNKMRDYSGVTPNPNGGAAVSSGQFNQSTHVCSNVYCHSNSKTKNPRIGKFANPPDAWNSGVTLRKCNYCHGRQGHGTPVAYDSDANFSRYSSTGVPNYTSGLAGYSTANSHRQHLSAMGTTDYSNTNVCYSCHSATLDSTTGKSANAAKFRPYSSRHTSGAYNVKMKTTYGGSYNATMGTKSCSATLCHGGVSPKWGANTTNDSCTKCHGTPSASVIATTKYLIAPPFNTSQGLGSATGTGQVSNDPKVGAHQTHLRFTNGFSNYSTQTFMCENCHGTTLPTDTAHITGNSAPVFQRLARNNAGAMNAVWTAASLTCSNTYCHNPAGTGGTLNTGNVGTLTFVSWTASTYLGDTAKTETNCNRCHKSPGATAGAILLSGTSTHSGVKIADDCSGCHGHNGNNIGPVGRRHIDGIKYGGGGTSCDGCHSYDEGDWAGAAHNFGGQGQGKGAHAKHINHLKTRLGIVLNATTDYSTGYGLGNAGAVCGVCHSNTLGDHSTGDSTAIRNVNFNASTTYKFGPSNPTYNGTYNTSSATNPKSCSNVSCHYFTTPNWSAY